MIKLETKDKDDINDFSFELVDDNTGLEFDLDFLPICLSKKEVYALINTLSDLTLEMKE